MFDVNGAITLSVPGDDDTAAVGDLDVTDALTIIGNGVSNTIVQAGPSAGTGIDKIFSFNPRGAMPGFAVSLSGPTLQYGRNTVTTFGNSEGGAFDFDAGSDDGAGSLSIANCIVTQTSTINGDGGGIALFDGGVVSITGASITGNQAHTTEGMYNLGEGGGIFIGLAIPFPATVTITNTTIANNSASTAGQATQYGGGVYSGDTSTLDVDGLTILTFKNLVSIHGSMISGNHADSDGGGLYGSFTVDQASILSNNVSGELGGGIWGAATVTGSTLTGNSSLRGGGAVFADGPGTSITNSRIFGNIAGQGASGIDGIGAAGATVAAGHNWWGSNASPVALVNPAVVTYSPWLTMTFGASPTTISSGATATLTAAINTASDGTTGYSVADGTAVTFSGTLGTVSPINATTTAGVATSTYTAGANPGSASVTATIDGQTLSAAITVNAGGPRALTVTPAPNTKTYDGTTSAAAIPTITSGSLAPGDMANFSEAYADKTVGAGKVLIPSGSVNDGHGGANYTITFVNSTGGAITAKPRLALRPATALRSTPAGRTAASRTSAPA